MPNLMNLKSSNSFRFDTIS